MTTYATYTDGRTISASGGSNAAGAPAQTVITNTFDAARRNLASTNVAEVLSIPARSYVHQVQWRTLTADSGQTISIGDGSGTSSWIADADCAAADATGCSTLALTAGATPGFVETITGYSGGKYYSAADTIDILCPSGKAYDTLKVQVSAVVTLFG